MSCLARWGSTTAAASVPATTTLWCSKAETIWPAQVVWRLHPCFLSLASILALPACFRSAGVGQAATGLQDGVVRLARALPRSRGLGGVWVSHWPWMRPSVWLTWRARSRSKPASTLSAAASSSELLTALRVNRPGFDGGSDDTEGSCHGAEESTPMSCGNEPRG